MTTPVGPSGIDFETYGRSLLKDLREIAVDEQSYDELDLVLGYLYKITEQVAAQAREEAMADTRRKTAIEACKSQCKYCGVYPTMRDDKGLAMHLKPTAMFGIVNCLSTKIYGHFGLTDADFAMQADSPDTGGGEDGNG